MSLKIGNAVLPHGLILAPMAGVTDLSCRQLCRRYGAEYTVTEMVSAKAIHFGDEESFRLARPDGSPGAVQIFGHEPEIMAEAARRLWEYGLEAGNAPTAVDINMGCPMKKITSNGEGSALMKDLPLAGRIIAAVVKAVPVPVTVKFRTGWNENSKNAPALARAAEESGASLITVHGRTREQLYAPPVDPDTIAAVKAAVSVPVVANGGIETPEDAMRMLSLTHCDGLMIGRGAMGNPWLFEEIAAVMDGIPYTRPTQREIFAVALEQAHAMLADKGERIGTLEARRHLSYYIKGIRGAAELRRKLMLSDSVTESEKLMMDFLERSENEPEEHNGDPSA